MALIASQLVSDLQVKARHFALCPLKSRTLVEIFITDFHAESEVTVFGRHTEAPVA
jgi:hypothetical protein